MIHPDATLYSRLRRTSFSSFYSSHRLLVFLSASALVFSLLLMIALGSFFASQDTLKTGSENQQPSTLPPAPIEPPIDKRRQVTTPPSETPSRDSDAHRELMRSLLLSLAGFSSLVPLVLVSVRLFSSRPVVVGVAATFPILAAASLTYVVVVFARNFTRYWAFFALCPNITYLPAGAQAKDFGMEAAFIFWILLSSVALVSHLGLVVDTIRAARKMRRAKLRLVRTRYEQEMHLAEQETQEEATPPPFSDREPLRELQALDQSGEEEAALNAASEDR